MLKSHSARCVSSSLEAELQGNGMPINGDMIIYPTSKPPWNGSVYFIILSLSLRNYQTHNRCSTQKA